MQVAGKWFESSGKSDTLSRVMIQGANQVQKEPHLITKTNQKTENVLDNHIHTGVHKKSEEKKLSHQEQPKIIEKAHDDNNHHHATKIDHHEHHHTHEEKHVHSAPL